MHILCLGLNHNTALVALREKLAFNEQNIQMALSRLGCRHERCPGSVSEMAILSTCNRVEIYATSPSVVFDELEAFLEETRGVPRRMFSSHLYRLADEDAVAHLFDVAAGLDSMILGEPQILGQVARALSLARSQGTAGKILTRLFQSAIHAGKRARTETLISQNPATISSLAARLIAEILPHLSQAHIAVLGAGEMAELAVEALLKRGAQNIYVINRTLERARELSVRWGASAAAIELLPDLLKEMDVLIASTGAPHTLVSYAMVADAMRHRPDRPLVMVDIAVPRDVDPQVGTLSAVTLFDLDMLSDRLEDSLDRRLREVPQVERILAEERETFLQFLEELEVQPIIAALRQQADAIRIRELEKTLRRMPQLTPEEQERLDAMTRSIVNKILHHPTAALRGLAGMPESAEIADFARQLFGLEN